MIRGWRETGRLFVCCCCLFLIKKGRRKNDKEDEMFDDNLVYEGMISNMHTIFQKNDCTEFSCFLARREILNLI